MQPKEDYVLKLLEDAGLVTRSQIERAKSRLNGAAHLVEVLIKDGVVSDADVSRTLAAQAHMDWVDLSTKSIPQDVIEQIRAEDARRFKVIPVGYGETGLIIAVSDPLDIDTIDSLSFLLQREIELVCTSPGRAERNGIARAPARDLAVERSASDEAGRLRSMPQYRLQRPHGHFRDFHHRR